MFRPIRESHSESENHERALKQPIIVDLRNVYRPGDVRKRGFTYLNVGRK